MRRREHFHAVLPGELNDAFDLKAPAPSTAKWRRRNLPMPYLRALLRLFFDLLKPTYPLGCLSLPDGTPCPIRQARFWECLAVARFDHLIFPKTNPLWETVLYLLKMRLGGATFFIVRDPGCSGRLIATVYMRSLPLPATGFISNVGVHPDYRRLGLAERILKNVVFREARRRGLKRLVLNVQADSFVQRFYERLGFRVTNRLDRVQTAPGEQTMLLELKSAMD